MLPTYCPDGANIYVKELTLTIHVSQYTPTLTLLPLTFSLSYCLTFSHVYLILLDQPESIAMDIHDLQVGILA